MIGINVDQILHQAPWLGPTARLPGGLVGSGIDADFTRRAKVFVSHSTLDSFTSELVETLASALHGAGFTALVDQKVIEAGDEWSPWIYDAVQECSAAVLLLSSAALRSSWVMIESWYLTNRSREDSSFAVIPVLCPDVSIEDLSDPRFDISDLALHRFQVISGESIDDTVGGVVRILNDALSAVLDAEEVSPFQNQIEDLLSGYGADNSALMRLLARMNPSTGRPSSRNIAAKIAQRMLADDVSPEALALEVGRARFLGTDRREIAALVMSYKAVPAAAARQFVLILKKRAETAAQLGDYSRSRPGAAALIYAQYDETGRWYVRRSSSLFPSMTSVTLSPSPWDWQPDHLDEAVEDALRRQLIRAIWGWDQPRTDDQLNEDLDAHERNYGPVVVVLASEEEPDGELLDSLREKYPGLVFLVLSTAPDLALLGLSGTVVLEPLLTKSAENRFHRAYQHMSGAAERAS